MPETIGIKHFFEPDDVFADYTILQFCGRGAYGEVYLAEDITHKTVALKVIPILSGSEIWRMELIGLRHYRQLVEDYHALIEVHHVGETDTYFYYTMEAADNMLHGESDEYIADTLSHRLERGGRLEPDKVLELAHTILDALETLSEHNLAHRDLKPANIVFINGQAKLSDIGLISNTGVRSKVVGTVDFLPPEMSDGDLVGYGNDLYALGKVLYCALTGLLPEHFPEVPLAVPHTAWRQFKPILLKACSPDPRQRFHTPEEFRKALPSAIREANVFDHIAEELRIYRRLYPLAWRLSIIMAIAISFALGLSGYLALQQRHIDRSERQQQSDFIFSTIDMLNDQQPHLQRLAAASGNLHRWRRLEILANLAAEARAVGDWENTERYCNYANNTLRLWAEEEFRQLCDSYPPLSGDVSSEQLAAMLMAYCDFEDTPLASMLLDTSATQLRATIEELRTLQRRHWQGPLPGEDWQLDGDMDLMLRYIARGRNEDEPPESYWIGINEVSRQTLLRLYSEESNYFANLDHPAANLSWNDRLEICRILTLKARAENLLPKGYIYRLPYADEWLFALRGGWNGSGNMDYENYALKDFAWYGGNSMYQAQSVRSCRPSRLGLFDMVGNVAECVVLSRDLALPLNQLTGNYGGSFRDRRVDDKLMIRCEPEELHNNWSGMRLVLGPGSDDYFEKLWYTGDKHTIEIGSRRYEMLGGEDSRWTGELGRHWSKLLKGRLAVLGTSELRNELWEKMPRVQLYSCLIGAEYTDGQWRWLDKTVLQDGSWLNQQEYQAKDMLTWDHAFFQGMNPGNNVQAILVEWSRRTPEKKLHRDWDDLESPVVLKKFKINGKKMALLHAPVDWYTARRLCELLGGKLAMPAAPEEQEQLRKALSEFDMLRVALGGYRRCGEWCWLDQKSIGGHLPADRFGRGVSLNSCFVGWFGDKLCNSDYFDALLCEFPE